MADFEIPLTFIVHIFPRTLVAAESGHFVVLVLGVVMVKLRTKLDLASFVVRLPFAGAEDGEEFPVYLVRHGLNFLTHVRRLVIWVSRVH